MSKIIIIIFLFLNLTALAVDSQPVSAYDNYVKAYQLEQKGELVEAGKLYEIAADQYHEEKNYLYEAKVLERLGIIFYSINNPTNALHVYTQVLKIRKRISAPNDKIAQAMFNMAQACQAIGKYDSAGAYLIQALNLYESAEMKGDCYHQLAFLQKHLGQYDQAIKYYIKAIDNTNEVYSKARIYNNLGDTYEVIGDTTNAINYYNKSIETTPIASAFINLGLMYKHQGKIDQAISYLLAADSLKASDNIRREQLRALTDIYDQQNDLAKYRVYNKLYLVITDRIADAKTQLEEVNKTLSGKLLARDLNDMEEEEYYTAIFWQIGGLSALLALMVGGILYYRKKRRIRKINKFQCDIDNLL